MAIQLRRRGELCRRRPALGIRCDVTLADGSQRELDCNRLALCTSCDCEEEGCSARNVGHSHTLWLARGDQLIGYVSRSAFEASEVGPFMRIGAGRFDREVA